MAKHVSWNSARHTLQRMDVSGGGIGQRDGQQQRCDSREIPVRPCLRPCLRQRLHTLGRLPIVPTVDDGEGLSALQEAETYSKGDHGNQQTSRRVQAYALF